MANPGEVGRYPDDFRDAGMLCNYCDRAGAESCRYLEARKAVLVTPYDVRLVSVSDVGVGCSFRVAMRVCIAPKRIF